MSTHPILWLYQRGFLDADQVQAFDGFLNLIEASRSIETKSVQLGRELIDAGRPRLTPPEAAVNSRKKLQRALHSLHRIEQLVLVALCVGKSISQIESEIGLKPRTAKRSIQNALTTLSVEWPYFDRRVKRSEQIMESTL